MDNKTLWNKCLQKLEDEVDLQDFNMWVRPLTPVNDESCLLLHAPNRFVRDWLVTNLLGELNAASHHFYGTEKKVAIELEYDTSSFSENPSLNETDLAPAKSNVFGTNVLKNEFTFDSYIEGKSNQIARAAAKQVSENPGSAYNPLFIYGGVGLGKTHLMHAVGNTIKANQQNANVAYVHSERFVSDMVSSIESNAMEQFKSYYRSLDALLIDDIQFFAGKNQSQEEFFHTFNTLLESGSQIIITSDKFPKEINNLQERLISRFESGLTVRIDPPELETRVAILKNKARRENVNLEDDVAFLIAKRVHLNVRELEGALVRLLASSRFTHRDITVELAHDTLQDLIDHQQKKISIDNIQKTVAEFYGIRVSDLKSKRRSRQVARPRQIAMSIAKQLTNLSLPDIGDAFGGRDHTTVIHAVKKVDELTKSDARIRDEYNQLLKVLSV